MNVEELAKQIAQAIASNNNRRYRELMHGEQSPLNRLSRPELLQLRERVYELVDPGRFKA